MFVRTETGLPTDPSVQSLSDIAASKPVLTITESVGKLFLKQNCMILSFKKIILVISM